MKIVLLFAFLFFTFAAQPPQDAGFKVGDYVDSKFGSTWTPCIVSSPLEHGGYGISCGPTDFRQVNNPDSIRARTPTVDDLKMAAETTAGLARLPRAGSGVGANYGTREPAACASRTAPPHGAPSAAQARQYMICDAEHVYTTSLFLVTNVKVQVAPISHPANEFIKNALAGDLDSREPIWDIRGSFTQFQCGKPASWDNAFARTHNCRQLEQPTAKGYCYKNTFGDWHCTMADLDYAGKAIANVMPPEGN